MSASATEYRLVWKRAGGRVKRKRFASRKRAERYLLLFGREPWRYMEPMEGPDDFKCCSGWECGCGGQTYREYDEEFRKDLPALEWGPWIEGRSVGTWAPLAAGPGPR